MYRVSQVNVSGRRGCQAVSAALHMNGTSTCTTAQYIRWTQPICAGPIYNHASANEIWRCCTADDISGFQFGGATSTLLYVLSYVVCSGDPSALSGLVVSHVCDFHE